MFFPSRGLQSCSPNYFFTPCRSVFIHAFHYRRCDFIRLCFRKSVFQHLLSEVEGYFLHWLAGTLIIVEKRAEILLVLQLKYET